MRESRYLQICHKCVTIFKTLQVLASQHLKTHFRDIHLLKKCLHDVSLLLLHDIAVQMKVLMQVKWREHFVSFQQLMVD